MCTVELFSSSSWNPSLQLLALVLGQAGNKPPKQKSALITYSLEKLLAISWAKAYFFTLIRFL